MSVNATSSDTVHQGASAEVPPSPVAAISLKLPHFWLNNSILWFAQVEAQFLTRHVTNQDTHSTYVVGSLQPEIVQVRDLLIACPALECYTKLKAELIRHTSALEQKRLHQ